MSADARPARDPEPVSAATTGIGDRFVVPNGAASSEACSPGALAGRNELLFPWVTLDSEGSARKMRTPAASQSMTTIYRNLTAKDPIAPKIASARI